jgi:hypothetical protein
MLSLLLLVLLFLSGTYNMFVLLRVHVDNIVIG